MLARVKRWIWNFFYRAGYSIRRNENFGYPDQVSFFKNNDVRVIFDLGANCGDTLAKYRQLFPKSSIHAFEAIPKLAEGIVQRFKDDKGIIVENIAVSNCIGTADFHVNSAIDTSSLLEVRQESIPDSYRTILNTQNKITVKTTTLDDYCESHKISEVDILKMDIQGGELAAIKGASRMLSTHSIKVIFAEVFVLPFYENQPLIGDITAELAKHGYILHNIYNVAYRSTSGRCSWMDAIYVSPTLRDESRMLLQKMCNDS